MNFVISILDILSIFSYNYFRSKLLFWRKFPHGETTHIVYVGIKIYLGHITTTKKRRKNEKNINVNTCAINFFNCLFKA